MAADEGGDPIHPHCLSCVSVTKCSARLEKRTSCQIVHCKLDCGASFHSCKCQEHQLLCPNVKVPCANAINGCPVWLLRSQVGSHLQHCPASLVYCTAEWNRWGWLGDTTNEPHCVDRSGKLQLDFALAMRDLRSLRNDSHFGKLCRGSRDDRMPVATAPRDVCISHGIPCPCNGSCSENDALDSHSPLGTLNGYTNHMGDTPVIIEEGAKCSDVDYRLMHVAGACYASKPGVALNVELCVEFLTRYQLKPDKVYTFSCGQVFRRDEYAWHYQNVHRDIHCGLNGWLEHRCPLAQYGCSFSRRRFHPVPSGSQLVYNEVLESFGLAFPSALEGRESGGKDDMEEQVRGHLANGHSYTNGACDESSTLSAALNGPAFSDFPFEVLQHIAAYLDAFSLNNFSLVSKRLRDVSCSLLKSRGMVDFRWEKCGTGGWRVRSKSWYFSNGFTPVRQWAFSDEENMSSHLRKCSYFDRNVKTMPTAVCFGIGNSRGPKTLLHLAL
ncbi:F-box only protein 30-like isoform X1 [Amblyomma americanum]